MTNMPFIVVHSTEESTSQGEDGSTASAPTSPHTAIGKSTILVQYTLIVWCICTLMLIQHWLYLYYIIIQVLVDSVSMTFVMFLS